MASSKQELLEDAFEKIKDLEEKLALAVEKVEELNILVHEKDRTIRTMAENHEQAQRILKSKIIMLEDFNKEYVIVSSQRATFIEATMKAEITQLHSNLAKAISQNDQLRDDFTLTAKINEHITSGQFVETSCSLKNISTLNDASNVLLSEEISFFGKWRLILFRNVNGILSMIIIMTKGISGMYQFKIELINREHSKTLTIEDEEYFRIMWPSNSIKILDYPKIHEDGFYDSKNNSLHLKFSVRTLPNEPINSYMMVERCASHKIEVKNFRQLLDQNVVNYCSFYDEQGFCWKLLLKRNNWFEKKGDDYFSAFLYLLNGMFNVSYDIVIEVINLDPEKNIRDCGCYTFESPSEYLYYGSFAPVKTLLNERFLDAEDSLHVNVTVSLTNPEHLSQYMPTLAKNLVDYNFKSYIYKSTLTDNLSETYDMVDELDNNWHVTIKINDGFYYSSKMCTVQFLKFVVQMTHGTEGEYEFLLELLHQNATKVICRPIRGYWRTKERYEISHFSSIDRILNEGHVGKDKSFTLRFSVRSLRLGMPPMQH